jgi:hypothetical protein
VAAPPVGCTSILYWAGCPGFTVLVAAVTVTHSCVAAGDAAAADPGPDPDPDEPPLGLMLGVGPGGGELGAVGRAWHTLLANAGVEWIPTRAAATVPTPSTAAPANAPRKVVPARLLRRRTPGGDPSRRVTSCLSIMG